MHTLERPPRPSIPSVNLPSTVRTTELLRSAALVAVGLVCMAAAAGWLLLGAHSWSGPVVLDLSENHGVHLTDPLAALPFVAGLLCWWRAGRTIVGDHRHLDAKSGR